MDFDASRVLQQPTLDYAPQLSAARDAELYVKCLIARSCMSRRHWQSVRRICGCRYGRLRRIKPHRTTHRITKLSLSNIYSQILPSTRPRGYRSGARQQASLPAPAGTRGGCDSRFPRVTPIHTHTSRLREHTPSQFVLCNADRVDRRIEIIH